MPIKRREFMAGMLLSTVAVERDVPKGKVDAAAHDAGEMAWPPGTGYESKDSTLSEEPRWLQVDLGSKYPVDAVKLYPKFGMPGDHFASEGFPLRFRLEASDDPRFAAPALIADHTAAGYPDPVDHIQVFSAAAVKARYVRLTVTRLNKRHRGPYYFALAKLDVLSGGKDVAEGRPISDSTSGDLGVTALTRPPRPQGEGIVTDNPANVISASRWKKVPYNIHAPLKGVTLEGGPLKTAFDHNIGYLLQSFTADELLKEFNDRAGKPNPAGLRKPDQFWQTDLAGSNAGRFLMGAGNSLRWTTHAELRQRLDQVVDGITACRQSNGYIMAYAEDTIFFSERGAYTRAWLTHGLIEAGYGGRPDAFQLLRGYYDWFDHCKHLPQLLRGAIQGVQGMIANTRIAHTPTGKPEDIQVIQRYFQEDYWLDQLARRESRAIWQYPYDRPHCYLITDLEAYLDIYTATGDRRYLDAVSGGWDLYRDHWEHVGGSIAICEFGSYPPDSYLLHAETGELCGSVFWAFLSQRFHFLYPDQEKYVTEIEKSIYNVALANQVGSQGIRYHADLAGKKDVRVPIASNTCCEGQGTRLLGALPEFIYSLAPDGVFVDLFENSSITWQQAGQPFTLRMETAFPFDPRVALQVSTATPVHAKIRVRIPSWANHDVELRVNDAASLTGKPGSYVLLDRTWANGDRVHFTLPMDVRLTHYTGHERVAGKEQYAVEYGPILLALVGTQPGEVDEKGNATVPVGPADLAQRLRPKPGAPLHFTIDGDPHHEYVPYWLLQDQFFTCYPVLSG
jgi:DUF1680 family protein